MILLKNCYWLVTAADDPGTSGVDVLIEGNVIMQDSSRCYVQTEDRLVVLVGIHDQVVVDTGDAVLVCDRENAQQVKQVVEYLHAHQFDEYV